MSVERVHAATGSGPRGVSSPALFGLFAAVGCAALVHEVVWTRLSERLFGGGELPVAATLVAVLGGMGLGGLLSPWVARRLGPLGGFRFLEALTAIYALLLPWLVPLLGVGRLDGLATFVFASLVFSAPAVAMGAGLPLLAQLRAAEGDTARDAGGLYASHAAGGVVGGLATAFLLLPRLDVFGATVVAATLQVAVVVLAGRLPSSGPLARNAARSPRRRPARLSREQGLVLLSCGGAGVATAVLQTVWTRAAGAAMGPIAEGFAIVAAVYVLSLAVGAGAVAGLARRTRFPAIWLACLLLLACAATFLGSSFVAGWPRVVPQVLTVPGRWPALALLFAGPIVPTIAFTAATFPLAVAVLHRRQEAQVARDVGWLVAAAAIGNVAGVLLATFLWIPGWGLVGSCLHAGALLAAAGSLAALAALRGTPARPPARPRHVLFLGLAGLCLALVTTVRAAQ